MRPFCGPGRFALAFVLAVGALEAQQRPGIVQSLDVSVPVAPMVVNVGGTRHLVHELHITNLQAGEVAITRLQVVRGNAPNVSIGDFRDSALANILAKPGTRRGQSPQHILAPDMRAVAYVWVALPPNVPPPATVRHRVEMSVRRPTDTVSTSFLSAEVAVQLQDPVVLDAPLRGGPWAALYDPLLMGGHRTAIYTVDGRARIPARFAIDWIQIPASGSIDAASAVDRNGLGAAVLAVADGIVATAIDDMPDNEGAPSAAAHRLENASGNHIAIDMGGGRFAFYEHLKRGSVRVKAGDRVRRGATIAQLGNSGSSTIGPHLHFHVSDANSPLGAEGLPFVFRRFEQLGAFRSIDATIAGERWTATPQRQGTRARERPSPNAVLRFP